ncbi:MAG: TraX family protein [Oliverpabstia sp.]|nr:TraX family protein [Oliverpabstia sp.]
MKVLFTRINNCIYRLDKQMRQFQFLTGKALKIIGILTMVIDHTCKIVFQWLLSNYWGVMVDNGKMSWERFVQIDNFIRFNLQSIGTIAFPLFCFLLTEGFRYTKSKKRYIGQMFVFALISEIPFDIGFFSEYSRMEGTFPFYFKYQNVFFTLFLGLVALVLLEKLSCKSSNRVDKIKTVILQVVSVAVISAVAELFCCDYGMEGILYIVIFYICRKNRIYQVFMFLLVYMAATGNQPPVCTLIACLIILLYNGKRGKIKIKYFFYGFYPIHILLLYVITLALGVCL